MAFFRQTFSSKAFAPVLSIAATAAAFVKYPPNEDRSFFNDYHQHDKRLPRHHLSYNHKPRGTATTHHHGFAACDTAAAAPKLNAEAPGSDPTDPTSVFSALDKKHAAEDHRPDADAVLGAARVEGFQADAVGTFHGMFPARQLFQPAVPYPLWNSNWDGRQPEATDDPQADKQRMRTIRKTGTTRHIVLIRHGQYDETHREDELKKLTPLGIEQAHRTGERIADMMRGADGGFDPCTIRSVRVSALTRARETADIIASHLDNIPVAEPNQSFNEGRPCHTIPGGPMSEKIIKVIDDNHRRIEGAFRDLFVRADEPSEDATEQHEFEIVVCHANVIRYWMCRALQLPPEAWLRYCPFNCSLTYITIRPTGSVSCRMLGDIGHLPYSMQTFSGHHGYNW